MYRWFFLSRAFFFRLCETLWIKDSPPPPKRNHTTSSSSALHRSENHQRRVIASEPIWTILLLSYSRARAAHINNSSALFLHSGTTHFQPASVCPPRASSFSKPLPPGLLDLRVNLFQSIREMLGGRHRQLTSLCRVGTKSHLSKIPDNTIGQRTSQSARQRAAAALWKQTYGNIKVCFHSVYIETVLGKL